MDMKEQIQQLIAAGRTEDALNLLGQFSSDALLLQAQFNNGRKNFNIGLIEHAEWQRIQARVNYAALTLSSKYQPDFATEPSQSPRHQEPIASVDIFVSYHEADQFAADIICRYIEDKGFQVTTTIQAIHAGENIRDFIERQMKKQGFVVSLVSKNSLMSGWMGVETELAFYAGLFETRQFIPVALDQSFEKISFISEVVEDLDARLEEIYEEKQKRKAKHVINNDLNVEEERLSHLRNFLPLIVQRLKNHYMISLPDLEGRKFEAGMEKIIRTITTWQEKTGQIIVNSKNIIANPSIIVGGNLKIGDERPN